jgi:guanylate kinase
MPGADFSISHTTRAPRGHEQDGVDYHFVDDRDFQKMAATGNFLERAQVHGHRYGTHRGHAMRYLDAGTDVLFDIDIQGGYQIAEKLPGAVLVFILPPDMETLEARLRGRQSDADDEIERRLAVARAEIEGALNYTHWVVNDDLEKALSELRSILVSARERLVHKVAVSKRILGPGFQAV